MQKPQQRSQLAASQPVVHSIAIYINEMTAAKGRFILLFLLGSRQDSAVLTFICCYIYNMSIRDI